MKKSKYREKYANNNNNDNVNVVTKESTEVVENENIEKRGFNVFFDKRILKGDKSEKDSDE